MAEITLEAIAKTVESIVKQELEPVNTRLDNIESALASHTTSLELLITEKKNREDNKTVDDHRVERLEKWAKPVGEKVGLTFET